MAQSDVFAPPQVVIMEGQLKKRGANLPVMRDRYCVATWEVSPGHKEVVVRTYKTQAAYVKQPDKPVSVHALKCISEWSGKGNFHKYPHGFVMETTENKLFHCAAPTAEEKDKWIELMATVTTPRTVTEEPVPHSTDGSANASRGPLFSSDEDEEEDAVDQQRALADPNHIHDAQNELFSSEEDDQYGSQEDERSGATPVSPLALSPPDDKLLFRAGSSESLTESLNGDIRKDFEVDDEPADWAMYGDSDRDGPSRYDVVEDPVMLLDKDLLNGAPKSAAPVLASDEFLFEQNGPTFGAVIVPKSNTADDDNDFVDPRLVEQMERKKKEKELKRVTKKLESNRDLYAEMAAARLNSMRKDAKKPRRSVSRVHDEDDGWSSNDDNDDITVRGPSLGPSDLRGSSTSFVSVETPHRSTRMEVNEFQSEMGDENAEVAKLERRKSKKKVKQYEEVHGEEESSHVSYDDDLLFGAASAPAEDCEQAEQNAIGEEEQKQTRLKRERKEKKKKLLAEEDRAYEEIETAIVPHIPEQVTPEPSADDEEQRRIEKQRRREERRARKERERREAEEAAAAEELARQHREAMQRMEEDKAKQERRERKERKKGKEKKVLDKKAKELKKKEAELLAEAEKLKQQEALLKAEEDKKDGRKKKRRDKYTSPTERIHRRELEVDAHASEMSTALVVVEPTPAPQAEPAAAVTATADKTQAETPATSAEAAPASSVDPTPVAAPSPVSVPVQVPPAPVSAPATMPAATGTPTPPQAPTTVPPTPQSAPVQVPLMPQPTYYPAYPGAMPAYPMPFPYASPYPPMYPAGYPAAPYAAAPAVSSPYYPHLGYVGGIATMAPPTMAAFSAMSPPNSSTMSAAASTEDENAFIGPRLPSPKSAPAPMSAGGPPPPPGASTNASASSVLPDLPDVVEF